MLQDTYKDEYTCEEMPMGYVRLAMQEELEYSRDKVWASVPLEEAQTEIIGSR